MLKPTLISLILAVSAVSAAAQPKPQTVQEQVALRGLPVYSSEGRQVGQVTQVRIGGDGQVGSVRAELAKASGAAEAKTVEIPADKFTQKADRIELSMTEDEVGKLSAIN